MVVLIFVLVHYFWRWRRFPDACSSISRFAGLEGTLPDVSSGDDAENELALELEEAAANPKITIGTKFSTLHRIVFTFLVSCGF